MEGKTGRTKGKENTCRTVGITKALADSGHSAARKGFFYFFALKFGYSIETKNPNASPIRKVFGLFVCGANVHKGFNKQPKRTIIFQKRIFFNNPLLRYNVHAKEDFAL